MKKIYILLAIVICFIALYKLYDMWQYSNDKAVFVKLTSVSKFEVISDAGDNHYFYITAKISAKDKQKMLSMHYYLPLPVDMRGNVPCKFSPSIKNNYVYYLEDTGHGYLGYVLYFVSKVDNTVIVYDSYPD